MNLKTKINKIMLHGKRKQREVEHNAPFDYYE